MVWILRNRRRIFDRDRIQAARTRMLPWDENGNLRALPAWGVAVGDTHQWMDKWKSTVSYGYADVDAEVSHGPFALDHSHYVSANLIYQVSPSFRMGLEYLYGMKESLNGQSHDG